MPGLLERIAAKLAQAHARGVYRRFLAALDAVEAAQAASLRRALDVVSESEFGRKNHLDKIRSVRDLRAALPLLRYEDYRPWIDRVCDGDTRALFAPHVKVVMFAASSGTTAAPKRIPVTQQFVADYRRGWNTFGLKMLSDHPRAVLRPILQCSGRHDTERTPAGTPVGAITGLLARTQKRIVRRFYVDRPEIAAIEPPVARYYALMRLGICRDVAFAITANPATLIQMARVANEHSEALIRDIHDGTLSGEMVPDVALRQALARRLRPDPCRAAELTELRDRLGALRPRDYWKLEFLACWTGGSLSHYLPRLADWWGALPVRDIGLLASEGRVSIPLEDNTPIGVLDVTSAVFEFIPANEADREHPTTLWWKELEIGQEYAVVLSNTTGLLRYRLDDVVRVHGTLRQAPLVEFRYRAGRVASVAGEKLTENQVVAAAMKAWQRLGLSGFDFVLAPCWDDPPYYRLNAPPPADDSIAQAMDELLAKQNEEYASRRKSGRLGPLRVRVVTSETLQAMQQRLLKDRRSLAEQYKPPALLTNPGDDDLHLGFGESPGFQASEQATQRKG